MVRLEGESLNQLFSTLADWNQLLAAIPLDALEDFPTSDGPEHPGP